MKIKENNKFQTRMSLIKLVSIFILIIFSSLSLYSLDDLSLKELVNIALEKNYQIKIFKNEEIKLENSNTLGMAGFYPVLHLEGTKSLSNSNTKQTLYTGEIRQSSNATSDVSNASLNLNWNFFDGFKMFATKSKLNYLERIGKENTRFYIEQTAFDIAAAYFQLIKEIDKLKFLQESIKYSEDRLLLVEEKLKIGSSNNFEIQTAQFDYNSDSILIIQQKLLIKQLYLAINKIIIRDNSYEFFPNQKIQINDQLQKEYIENKALTNNISLNLEKIKQLIANQNVEINKSSLYPELSAFASYNFQDQVNSVSIYRSNRSYGLNYGITFSFNLYNGEQDAINVQNAKIDLLNNELMLKDKEVEIKNLVANSYNSYKSCIEIYQLNKQNSELASNSVEIAKKQLEVGSINSFDYRQIQLNFLNSNIQTFETEFLIKIKELELLKVSGTLLNSIMQ